MLYPLANLANLLMWGLILLGATWAYAKYRFDSDGFTLSETEHLSFIVAESSPESEFRSRS